MFVGIPIKVSEKVRYDVLYQIATGNIHPYTVEQFYLQETMEVTPIPIMIGLGAFKTFEPAKYVWLAFWTCLRTFTNGQCK